MNNKNQNGSGQNKPTPQQAQQLAQQAAQCLQKGDLAGAGGRYELILSHYPDHVEALTQYGLLLHKVGRSQDASRCLKRASKLAPKDVRSRYMLACIQSELGILDEAIDSYKACLSLQPKLIEAHNNLGVIYKNTEQYELAIDHFQAVTRVDPHSVFALSNLGNVLKEAGQMSEAIDVLDKAVKADPELCSAFSNLLIAQNYMHSLSNAEIYQTHREWGSHVPKTIKAECYDFSGRNDIKTTGRKLRVGFVSPDLHRHSVAYFVSPLFAHYDKNRFEFFAYYNNKIQDEVQALFESQLDHWLVVDEMGDSELADRIYSDEIDVLIDLAGHTADNRLAVFYQKPAPIQATWLGYPNTTGLTQVDYRIVDKTTDPESSQSANVEKLQYLPDCFLCYSPGIGVQSAPLSPEKVVTPALKKKRLTFGSFNNLVKVTPDVVETWSAILRRVEDSQLLIKSRQLGNELTRKRLVSQFADQGIDEARLRLYAMVPDHQAHLDLYEEIDIGLDPFPYNGTTTTCEALWMHVPVLSLEGDRHACRVGSSLLKTVGLDDFVATSREDYVEKAVGWAARIDELNDIRVNLRSRVEASPLRDEQAFTHQFQDLLLTLVN